MAPTKKNKVKSKATKIKTALKAKTKAVSKVKATTKVKTKVAPKVKTSIKAKAKVVPKVKASIKAKAETKAKTKDKGRSLSKVKSKTTPSKTARSSSGLSNKKSTGVDKALARVAPTSAKAKGIAWLQPLDDRLLVEIVEEPKVSPGGIILIDSTEQPENLHGIVLSIGRGHQTKKGKIRPIEAKKGDKIIFSKYSGDKITKDGVNFVVIRESDVLGFSSN